MKGQASLVDGILFFLVVSGAVALIFFFLSSYGYAQSEALTSSYIVDYVQDTIKALYYTDVSKLNTTTLSGSASIMSCEDLKAYPSNSVAMLLKKDISDDVLNDTYYKVEQPGKLALACALSEYLQPLVYTGYGYYATVLSPTDEPLSSPYYNISSEILSVDLNKAAAIENCSMPGTIVINAPFRTVDENMGEVDDKLRICVWPKS